MTGNERHFRLRVIQAGVGVTLGLAAPGAAYRGRATHFDPRVLDAFHSALDEILSVRSAHREVERRRATTTAPIPIRGAAGA